MSARLPGKGRIRVQRIRVLGVAVDVLSMRHLIGVVEGWIDQQDRPRWIAFINSFGIVESIRDPKFRSALESADLSVADGYRVRQAARRAGIISAEHLAGPDVMLEVCQLANERGYRVFFYGDTEEVLGRLEEKLKQRYPDLRVAGLLSPPFRALTEDEEQACIDRINDARPDILCVGLGMPKQEQWIARNLGRIRAPVSIAVGAAFKFHSGLISRAPRWMINRGLEWVWRFVHEPRRIFKRIVLYGPLFVVMLWLRPARLELEPVSAPVNGSV